MYIQRYVCVYIHKSQLYRRVHFKEVNKPLVLFSLCQDRLCSLCLTGNRVCLFIISSENDKKLIENLYHKIYISLYFFHIAS